MHGVHQDLANRGSNISVNMADNEEICGHTLPSVREASFFVTLEANRDSSSVPVKSLSFRPDPGDCCARKILKKTTLTKCRVYIQAAWFTDPTYPERNIQMQSSYVWSLSAPVQQYHLWSRSPKPQVDASFSLLPLASLRPLSNLPVNPREEFYATREVL